jgi:translocation and assembly module TamB
VLKARLAEREGKLGLVLHAPKQESDLVRIDARAQLSPRELAQWGASALFMRGWEMSLYAAEQPLARWPLPQELLPLRAGAHAIFRGDREGIEGSARVSAQWGERLPAGTFCDRNARPGAELVMTVSDRETDIRLDGTFNQRPVLTATTRLLTPWADWVEHRAALAVYPFDLVVQVHDLDLARIPTICNRYSGHVGGSVTLFGLASTAPRGFLQLSSENIRAPDANPIHATLAAQATRELLTASLVAVQGDANASLSARLPLYWAGGGFPTGVGETALQIRFDRAPVAPLAAWIPNLAQAAGRVSGRIDARGKSADELALRAHLTLDDVSLALKEPFVRLENVSGLVQANENRFNLLLISKSGAGTLTLEGSVGLHAWTPSSLSLLARLQDFPTYQEGMGTATVAGEVEIKGDLQATPRVVSAELRRFTVSLPKPLPRTVQPLARHPEVIYPDQPEFDPALTVRQALAVRAAREARSASNLGIEVSPVVIRVVTATPVWVRRHDFFLQVSADLTLRSDGDSTTISGPIELRRGHLVVLGKHFRVRRGTVRFWGTEVSNPSLSLEAVYRLSSGHEVSLVVEGPLKSPQLRLATTDPTATSNVDILALIAGVRGKTRAQATEVAAGAVGGMVAGLLGSLLREEYGLHLPLVTLQSAGTPATSLVRAGYVADHLIPEALRGVILGMYIEAGFGSASVNRGLRASSLIELFFPNDLAAAAAYETPDNWSLELLWER